MSEDEFAAITAKEWETVPDRFRSRIENVALLIEEEPSEEVRSREGLGEGEALLGLYHGIPNSERGALYGVGATLPDTITLYRKPLLEEAMRHSEERGVVYTEAVREVVRETLWHELGHYFGLEESPIRERETEGTNHFKS